MLDRKLTVLPIPVSAVDHAWKQGASELSKACLNDPEFITPEVLKSMLLRGEKYLFAVNENGNPKGWFVACVTNHPLFNSFNIYSAVGSGCTTQEVIDQIKEIAKNAGCTKLQCATSVEKLKSRYSEIGWKPAQQLFFMEC